MIRYYDPKRQEGDLPGLVPQPQVLFKYLDSDPLSAEIRENPCQLFDNTRYAGVMKAEGVDAFAVGKVDFFEKLAGERKYPGYLPEDKPGYEGPEWLFGGNMVCTILYLFPEGTVLADGLDEFSMKFAGVSPKDYLARGQCGPEFGRGAFNYDNRYIFSFLDPTRGETVMRVKNLKAAKYGQDMTRKDNDVRFWSLCVIQAENVMYTYACARDDQFVPDKSDPNFSTFIFTKKADKPAWACDVANVLGEGLSKDCKYNWLPYVSPVTWLYLRTLDANPLSPAYKYLPITFDLKKEAGGDPNNFEAVKKHMGPYYPDGEYCTFGATDTTQKSCEELLK
jgi:hypothetical protein